MSKHTFAEGDSVSVLHEGERFDGAVERMTKGGRPVVRVKIGDHTVIQDECVATGSWSAKEGKWYVNLTVMRKSQATGNLSEERWRSELIALNRSLV